ncbi:MULTISPECIES: pyroglutamyl-peptidase I [Jeotgalicoccus]|uniref:pyroglutamyl-peptidase I n=1 Tax=Jeotgalicoccus TaxID=227979 RepID=UPI0003FB3445|nr:MULTISPECIES: pyroglutamyl-peptidase I [Jeotgalicoccus]QQD85005.1 pyroglutamyl-peptidase I [Jeotgalicoccus sp. ATCC 8456]
MKTLLLTGYEPFLKFKTNPTQSVVESLEGKTIGGYKIVGRIYPVVFGEINSLIEKDIEDVEPDAIVSLGLANGIKSIHLERIAINTRDGREDNSGFKPSGERIYKDGADGLFSKLPLKRLEQALLDANIPTTISNSAGTYLCNNLMYSSLYYLNQKGLDIPAGFVHVPPSHEIGIAVGSASWSQEDITKAIHILIENLQDT